MKFFEFNLGKKFIIEKIETPFGEVSISPKRGGIITSLILNSKEILYLDRETFEDKEKSVRGGIPILFPNAGFVTDEMKIKDDGKFSKLKQHGFARSSEWTFEKNDTGFIETLKSNELTKRIYPYDFQISIIGSFFYDGVFLLEQTIKNLEKIDYLLVSSGLHPYFKVQNEKKKDIKFKFFGGEIIEREFDVWTNGGTVSFENFGFPLEIEIPDLGTLILNISKEYRKIWIWSEKGKDFICIEPVMRDIGGIVNDPEKIKAGDTYTAYFSIKLKE